METQYPPLAFLPVFASNEPHAGLGLMMTDWVQYDPTLAMRFERLLSVGLTPTKIYMS